MLGSPKVEIYPPIEGKRRFILHGRLKAKFGRQFHIGATTSARGIQMLCIMVPGFRDELELGEYRIVVGKIRTEHRVELDPRGLHMVLPHDQPLHIIPVARGSGGRGGGIGKIIIGVVLVVAAFVLPLAAPGLFGAAATAGTAAGTAGFVAGGGALLTAGTIFGVPVLSGLALFGGALILGGISAVVSSQPQQPRNTASFLLGGQLNVSQEGAVVPVVYGRTMCGSVVVSVGYEAAVFVNPGNEAGFVSPDGLSGTSGALFDSNSSPQKPGTPPGTSIAGTGVGGGGKSGGGGGGVEAPNTLRSMATVKIIDVVSEGVIKGLVNGPQGILLGGTPLMSADGTWNFRGISWTMRQGFPNQDPVPGFAASEEVISINQTVLHGTPVTQTINSSTANAVRVTIQIPGLFDTDTKSGNINPTFVECFIEIRPSRVADDGTGFTGSYVKAIDDAIHGKCTSPYERSYRFDLPRYETDGSGANTWDIRVTKVTQESTRTTLVNNLIFELLSVITDHKIMYADTAYVALEIDSASFRQGSVPTRSYIIDGVQVQVPLNYDPPTRTYNAGGPGTTNGTWDVFSFKSVQTDNPAWIFYDMVTNPRYGSGVFQSNVEGLRASLYVISQYCDGLVPDGLGGNEPRYRINVVVGERVEAFTMFQTMVAAFRGMTYFAAGQVMVTADMPKRPTKLINQANVVNGMFTYQGTSLKTRHNMVRVSWRDPSNFYRVSVEVIEITADIAKRGLLPADIIAWGCTSRGQARRVGKWILYTEHNQTEGLEYDGGPYHFDLRPGDIFQQHDPSYVGFRWGGRLRAQSTQSSLHLDDILPNPENSPTFDMTVVMPDNTVQERLVNITQVGTSPDGSHTMIDLSTQPLPQQPMPNAEWIAVDHNVSMRFFQTIMLTSDTPGQYHVTALAYDPTKFDQVELGIHFPVAVYSLQPLQLAAALPPPSNVSAQDYLLGIGNTTVLRVTVSWQAPSDMSRVRGFEVSATSATFQRIYKSDLTSYDIDNLVPDTYAFAVRSVGQDNQVSAWVSSPDVVVDGLSDPPQQVIGLTAVGGTRRISLSWTPNAERYLKYYEVQRAPAVGADPGLPTEVGNPGAPGSWAQIGLISGTSYLDQDGPLFPNTIWWYRIRAITTTDVPGTFSAPAWAKTNLLIADDLADGIINTAKFANSIKPVRLITDLSAPGLLGDIAYNEANGQLYQYEAGPPAGWYPLLDLSVASGQITSTQITDGAITTPKIAALSIDASKLQVNSVIAGKIAAGAISATEIRVGSIRADLLAADFQLTQSSQIGTAVIGTAQIDNLAVGRSNIKGGAISTVSFGWTYTVDGINPSYIYITTDGSPIQIFGSYYYPFNERYSQDGVFLGPGTVAGQLLRSDGATLSYLSVTGIGTACVPITYFDQPGIGTFGYSVSPSAYYSTSYGLAGAALILMVLSK